MTLDEVLAPNDATVRLKGIVWLFEAAAVLDRIDDQAVESTPWSSSSIAARRALIADELELRRR
jgi:hypothetical protein